jgi:hypothetical protein
LVRFPVIPGPQGRSEDTVGIQPHPPFLNDDVFYAYTVGLPQGAADRLMNYFTQARMTPWGWSNCPSTVRRRNSETRSTRANPAASAHRSRHAMFGAQKV